jgi:dTDP-4-dehydrorhamnose 3,5-epimerase
VWGDERGFFREWFKHADLLKETGLDFSTAQANISSSRRGVVRGIHYSLTSNGQAKWVTCVSGLIRDVIVDIRPNSPTFGKYEVVELSGTSGRAVLIGAGLGHGFISMADASTVAYLLSSPYSPNEEYEINPLDPEIGIEWLIPSEELIFSPKDLAAPSMQLQMESNHLPIL